MNPHRRELALALLGAALPGVQAAPSDEGGQQALLADPDYATGAAALKAQDFAAALPKLLRALKRFPDAADLHNDLGYTFRKLGQLDPAFSHYHRALAIDPRHRAAHEYIGEAYLLVDDPASAEQHLQALRSICILACEELRDLEAALAAYRRRQLRGGCRSWAKDSQPQFKKRGTLQTAKAPKGLC